MIAALGETKAKNKPLQPASSVKPGHADWPVVAAVFTNGSKVTVAQGNAIRPMFQTVSVDGQDGGLASEVALPNINTGLLSHDAPSTVAPVDASVKPVARGGTVLPASQSGSVR